MSKKGRTSIVLLGSLVLALICVPLVYLAYGAKLDRDALNNRIALLAAMEIASPAAFQADYRDVIDSFLPILPPDADFRCGTSQGIVVFDPANFEGWADVLEPAELDGVTVYPVTVAEDPETRYTVFYNALDEPIATQAPEQGYNPFAWLELVHPEYFDVNADPADLALAESLYDPARMSVTYFLLSVDDVEAMAEAWVAATAQQEFEMSMMMGEEPPEPATNLVFFAIEKTTNGTALGITWGEDFTNKIEVFARSTIAATGWFVASTNLSTAGTNSLWWVDTDLSNVLTRFYSVGNADLDSDADGLTDAREWRIYGTDESSVDSDEDGLVDGYSGRVSTNAHPAGAHTNGGITVEGELTWGTDLLLADTDDDGMADGWEVENGHDPLDPNDPPNVSGAIMYEGGQAGSFWVVAVTSSNSWSTNHCDVPLASSYRIANLSATNYWLKGWLDANENGTCEYPEATGFYTNNPVLVTNKVGGVDIILTDPDLDTDNLPDCWEIACFDSTTNWNGSSDPDGDQYTNLEEYEAGTSPVDDLDHPWNIGGTISYNGPQTGTIYVVACTSATEWAAARNVTLATPGAYVITHLPPDRNYWIRAWRDSNVDEIPAFWEAWGEFQDNPITLNTNVVGVDVTLQDGDSDEDFLPDWWEVLYGFDPQNGGGGVASAWWKLDATAGTNVQDSTSNSNNGILVNAGSNSWTGGVINNALSFDGVDDYVQIPDSDSLKPNFVSVSLWVNPSRDYTNGSAVLFSKKQGSTGYRLSYEQGALSFLVCASGEKAISQPTNLASGVWHHVVGTYGGESQKLYVDGVLAAETNFIWGFAFGYIDQGTTSPRIGTTPGTASNLFAGLIDDVQIYSGELTSNQVWGIYETGSDEDGDGLSIWQEYLIGLCPTNSDTDTDGLLDGDELNLGTDPFVADTDRDGFTDGADSNATSRVFIKWGDPKYTSGDYYQYPGPSWCVAAYKASGIFVAEPPFGWQGGLGPFTPKNMVCIPAGIVNVEAPDYGAYSLTVNVFSIDRTEVTKSKWDEVRNWGLTNGYTDIASGDAKGTNHPIQAVNWYDCVKWCNARSELEKLGPACYTTSGKTEVYRTGNIALFDNCVNWGSGYRLPTKEEWEYAARGGIGSTRFPWGNTISHTQANYYSSSNLAYDVSLTRGFHPSFSSNGTPFSSPVGSFEPNGYGAGLYDMVGNINEWTWDWYTGQYAPCSRGLHGGSWENSAASCQPGFYFGDIDPNTRWNVVGFRPVLVASHGEELVIAVDRTILTNDVVMSMDFLDQTNSSLYIGLADTNHALIVSNLFGNLLHGSGVVTNFTSDIPFTNYPNASEIRMWSDQGTATIYTNRLYIDDDHDGLDAAQEEQLGTSDNPDTDGDGLLDFAEERGEASYHQSMTTNSASWVEASTGAVFITQWSGIVGGRIDASYSLPISFPVILGAYTGSTFSVAADGYLIVDGGFPSNTPSMGINLPQSNRCVAVFWDDLTISASTGIWVEASGTGDAARLTVTWTGAQTKSAYGEIQGLDFQCCYNASNHAFAFHYRDSSGKDFPSNAFFTVGIWGNNVKPKASISFNHNGTTIMPDMSITISPAFTDPLNADTDGDGLSDGLEASLGFDPSTTNSPFEDYDKDGLVLEDEMLLGTNPTLRDSDHDGWTDCQELRYSMNPLQWLAPQDDADNDGLSNWGEWEYGTDPLDADTDNDGVSDGLELSWGRDPTSGSDGAEVAIEASFQLEGGDGVGGAILRLGNFKIRRAPGETGTLTRNRWVKGGQAYELALEPVEGETEDSSVETSIQVGNDTLYAADGVDRSFCGEVIIDQPNNSLGTFSEVVDCPTSTLIWPALSIWHEGYDVTESGVECHGSETFTAEISPELDGDYVWEVDGDYEGRMVTSSGAVAVITVTSQQARWATVTFTPAGSYGLTFQERVYLYQDHVCRWGTLNLSLPLVGVNDNDSEGNGTNDCNQAVPASNDSEIREGKLTYIEAEDKLDCCELLYPSPVKVSLSCGSFDKVRVWNEGGTTSFVFPDDEVVGDEESWTFKLEGTNESVFAGDVQFSGKVKFTDNSESPTTYWGTSVFTVDMVPDFNHDRAITAVDKSLMASNGPFRFWINNDSDNGDFAIEDSDFPEHWGAGANYFNWVVDGSCDLLDFFPIWLNLHQALSVLPPGENVQYKLHQNEESVKAVYTDLPCDQAGNYLITNSFSYGPNFNQTASNASVFAISDDGTALSAEFLTKISVNGSKGVLLMEGHDHGTSPLVLEIWENSVKIYEKEMPLSVDDVDKMYRTVDLHAFTNPGVINQPANYPDLLTNGKNLVFLHGYQPSIDDWWHKAWISDIFKRFYQSGSLALFHGVKWDSSGGFMMTEYQNAVVNSFLTASPLTEYVSALTGEVTVVAHSLGNIVVSSAIADYGMSVSNYFMCDAAVASEAFDGSISLETNMVSIWWTNYVEQTWAAKWYQAFEETDDSRKNLKWPDRFAGVFNHDISVWNIHSTGDEIFSLTDNPGALSGAFRDLQWWLIFPYYGNVNFGRFSWQKQELFKGVRYLGNTLGGTIQAGWGFEMLAVQTNDNEYQSEVMYIPIYTNEINANAASNASLRTNPVFKHYPSWLVGTNSLSTNEINELLGMGIPALTPSTGKTSVGRFDNEINLNTAAYKPNEWPMRGYPDDYNWLHNDMKDVAFFYNYMLFDKIATDGGLK